MEAADSFETLVTGFLLSQRHMAEYKNLHTLRPEEFNSRHGINVGLFRENEISSVFVSPVYVCWDISFGLFF
jgi:hypothetical protein